jgi:hypothetical protein
MMRLGGSDAPASDDIGSMSGHFHVSLGQRATEGDKRDGELRGCAERVVPVPLIRRRVPKRRETATQR